MGQGIPTLMAGYFNYIEGPQKKRGRRACVDEVESRKFQGFIKRNGPWILDLWGLGLLCAITIMEGRGFEKRLIGLLLGLIRSKCIQVIRYFTYLELLLIIGWCWLWLRDPAPIEAYSGLRSFGAIILELGTLFVRYGGSHYKIMPDTEWLEDRSFWDICCFGEIVRRWGTSLRGWGPQKLLLLIYMLKRTKMEGFMIRIW